METMKARAIHPHSMRTLVLAAFLLIALALGACGGGGGGAASTPSSGSGHPSSAANPAPVDEPAPVVDSGDLDLAGRIYQGDERTPDGFQVETRPSNVVGTLSTRQYCAPFVQAQLVGFVEQNMSAPLHRVRPVQQSPIQWTERVPRIHDNDQTTKRTPRRNVSAY